MPKPDHLKALYQSQTWVAQGPVAFAYTWQWVGDRWLVFESCAHAPIVLSVCNWLTNKYLILALHRYFMALINKQYELFS